MCFKMVRDLVIIPRLDIKQIHICEKCTHGVKIIDTKVESKRRVEIPASSIAFIFALLCWGKA